MRLLPLLLTGALAEPAFAQTAVLAPSTAQSTCTLGMIVCPL